jgi:hypothetical protein
MRRCWYRPCLEWLEDRTVFASHLTALNFTAFQTAHSSGFLAAPNDFDLYTLQLNAGDQVNVAVSAQTAGSGLQSVLRIFNSAGDQVALDDQEGGDPQLTFQAAAPDTYTIGVSSAGDDAYNPHNPTNPGQGGTTTGRYTLDVRRTPNAPLQADVTGASFRLSSGTTAAYGEMVSGTFTIDNRGGAASTGFSVQLVLSSGTRFDGFDPSVTLPAVLASGPPTGLPAGQRYTSSFTATLPDTAPAKFPSSGPVYVGLLITPNDPTADSGQFDKSGVHRGEDFENLTLVTPAPAGTTNLSSVDSNLDTRVSDTLSGVGGMKAYQFTVTNALGSGRLTASVVTTSGTLIPRITLSGVTGQVLNTSDDGTLVQNLVAGTYILSVSAAAGGGGYRMTTEFVHASPPLTPITVGSNPDAVAVVDLNGDGIPDLVVANGGNLQTPGDTVSVLLGNGDGTFQPQHTFAVGSYPRAVAVADLNGDGKPDLIIANEFDNTVSVLLGNGDGTFQTQHTFAVGTGPDAVAVADLNGDGIPDLVVANGGVGPTGEVVTNTMSVLLGNGDGSFKTQQTFDVGDNPDAVAVADLNGDGKPDLVVANVNNGVGSGTVSVLLGNGDGTFQTQHMVAVGSVPSAVAVTDLNGDGKPDLVVLNSFDNTMSVLLGNGDGSFQTPHTTAVGSHPSAVAVADLTGDGIPDLVVANTDDHTVSVLLGNGDGSFQTQLIFDVGSFPDAVAVADLNGDGKPDLVAANANDTTVNVLLGNGDGSFQTRQTVDVGAFPDAVAVADLNGDGKPDLIVTNRNNKTVSVLLGNGDGTFQPQQTFAVGSGPFSVAVADLNGDGKPDLVVFNGYTVSVLLGNGDGTFQPQQTIALGHYPNAVVVADVNGDGKPDLIVAHALDNTVGVLLGNGDGTFQPQHIFAVRNSPVSVAVADLNGDGKPDLVGVNFEDNTVSVLLGNGDGTFQPQQIVAFGSAPIAVAVADVNGDGKPDLVVANSFGPMIVLLGNGDGSFQPPQTLAVGFYPAAVAVADVNGDGKPDLVVAHRDSNTVSVLLGNGDGTFQPPRTFAVGFHPTSVAVADVNGDGKPDLVVTNAYNNTVSVLLGDGTGSFTPITPTKGTGLRNTPYLANLTGHPDGTLDSVILDGSGNLLFRQGLSGSSDSFAPPKPINAYVINNQTGKTEELTARDLTVLHLASGEAVATADAIPDPNVLATEHQFVYSVSLYTGGPDDKFQHTTAFTTNLLPMRIAAADLTGDDLDDIVVADSLNNSIQVAFQQADGTFSSPLTIPVGIAPSDIALVDVNGDGLLDVVVTDESSGDVAVILNQGNRSFAPAELFRAGTGLYGLDSASATPAIASLVESVSLAAGDFTGDGRTDLVVVNRGTHSFSVLPNDGSGGFKDPQTALTTSTSDGLAINDQPGPVVAGYFNGPDQPLDLAILMEDTAQVWIYTGDGHGHFTHTASISAGSEPTGLKVVPGSGPGLYDLLVGDQFGDILRLVGDGKGHFQPPPPLTGDHTALDVKLLGPDGAPEALVADQKDNLVTVQTPTANGTQFVQVQTLAGDPTNQLAPGAVQWAKLEPSSPFFDAVVVASGSNSVLVYHTLAVDPVTGIPTFAPPVSYPVGTDPVSVTIQDINGDGIPDMIIANKGSNDVSTLFGSLVNGQWAGRPGPRDRSGGSGPIATAVRQLPGQSRPSLIITNSDGTVSVLPGRGQGFFDDRSGSVQTFTVPGGPGLGPPSFIGNSNVAVAAGGDGSIVRIDVGNFTATVLVPAGEDVQALQALDNGDVVAALKGGTVEEFGPDGSNLLTFTSFNGLPTDPSALEVLPSGEVLVTDAGQDQVFVFFGLVEGVPVPGFPVGPRPESTPLTPVGESGIAFVPTLLTGESPQALPSVSAGSEAVGQETILFVGLEGQSADRGAVSGGEPLIEIVFPPPDDPGEEQVPELPPTLNDFIGGLEQLERRVRQLLQQEDAPPPGLPVPGEMGNQPPEEDPEPLAAINTQREESPRILASLSRQVVGTDAATAKPAPGPLVLLGSPELSLEVPDLVQASAGWPATSCIVTLPQGTDHPDEYREARVLLDHLPRAEEALAVAAYLAAECSSGSGNRRESPVGDLGTFTLALLLARFWQEHGSPPGTGELAADRRRFRQEE